MNYFSENRLGDSASTTVGGSAQLGSGGSRRPQHTRAYPPLTRLQKYLGYQYANSSPVATCRSPSKTSPRWARQRGTTLIELSVVIAVILLLVGVLFIGVQAWKDGANKAACIVTIASVQKAVRGYQNMNGIAFGGALAASNIAGAGLYFATMPTEPAGGTYTLAGTIPAQGTAALTCSKGHVPASTANW